MMEENDIHLLNEMRQTITNFRYNNTDIGELADRLLALRDRLQFKDCDWFREVTQHIATLDSGSTYVPTNDEEARQADAATITATGSLLKLIEAKRGGG